MSGYDPYDSELNVPQEIKSETYFGKGVFLLDLAIIGGYWFLMSSFDSLIYKPISIIYTAFNVMLAFLLTRKSIKNPKKRVYESLIIYFLSLRNNSFHATERRAHEEIEFAEENER